MSTASKIRRRKSATKKAKASAKWTEEKTKSRVLPKRSASPKKPVAKKSPPQKRSTKPIGKKPSGARVADRSRKASPRASVKRSGDKWPRDTKAKAKQSKRSAQAPKSSASKPRRTGAQKTVAKPQRDKRKIAPPKQTPKPTRSKKAAPPRSKKAASKQKTKSLSKIEKAKQQKRKAASEAGWETRRFNDAQRRYVERTKQERKIQRRRQEKQTSRINLAYMKGAFQIATDTLSQSDAVQLIEALRSLGVRAFRFTRQVPATPSYPKGVSSTQWLDLKSYTPKKLNNLIGGMMQPGIDFMRYMMILEDDLPKLPASMRNIAEAAMRRAGYED